MNIIISFKPVSYMNPKASYAGIARVNLESGKVEKLLKFPSAIFKTDKSFMTSNAQGLVLKDGIAYVGLWNYIAIVDLDTFTTIDAFSSPEFSDVHSLEIVDDHLYVVSTASEVISCFELSTLKRKWYWGAPNSNILKGGRFKFLPIVKNRYQRKIYNILNILKYVRTPNKIIESRYIHKTCSSYYRHHMNNITYNQGHLYVNTKGWFDTRTSAVIKLNIDSLEEEFFVEPGGFIGSHDGYFFNGKYYVTEADNNSIAWKDSDNKIERIQLKPENYFIRGLEKVNDSWIVGFTPSRGSNNVCLLKIYNEDFNIVKNEININDLLPREIGVAVHTIKLEP
ncbi:hypothetical protein [Calidifontibacillus oryziterrae]|uniref:hypothetical protein n=1 Tax=Calidifontibacillus oryziterrae TaxID=1191699 RepID=UPI0002E90E0D|nr:hypothetical protein [Calidifontibacillus oryziterrae]